MSNTLPETESSNPRSIGLDRMPTKQLVKLLIDENRVAVDAVLAESETIARVVEAIVARLAFGYRLHYVGAGTSGRIAFLDASEIPPTFGAPRGLVCAHIAGGETALTQAVEGAEDDAQAGSNEMESTTRQHVNPNDVVIGISASGGAPYVIGALEKAVDIGAYTVAICNNENAPIAKIAYVAIVLRTGPEALAGSTRLKAGTAQKIALNALSTAVMTQLGKVYDNLMVDLVATNDKLYARAVRLVMSIAKCDEQRAKAALTAASGSVKIAIVMEARGVMAEEAREILALHSERLRDCLC